MMLPSDQDSTGRTFGEEEIRYVTEALNSGTLTTTKGKFGKMLEKAFAELRNEMKRRPEMAWIPLQGILRMMSARPSTMK